MTEERKRERERQKENMVLCYTPFNNKKYEKYLRNYIEFCDYKHWAVYFILLGEIQRKGKGKKEARGRFWARTAKGDSQGSE